MAHMETSLTTNGIRCAHGRMSQAHRPQSSPFRHQNLPQRRRLHKIRASASEDTDVITTDIPEPEDARGAIAVSPSSRLTMSSCPATSDESTSREGLFLQVGLEQYNAGSYKTALGIFEKAIDLPGTGIKQFRYV